MACRFLIFFYFFRLDRSSSTRDKVVLGIISIFLLYFLKLAFAVDLGDSDLLAKILFGSFLIAADRLHS
jgi:hypothetical protein